MSFLKCSFLLLCLRTTGVLSEVSDAFIDAGISSDTGTKPPQEQLQVTYGINEVNPGDGLGDAQVASEPLVSFGRSPSSYFSLFMIDPDALGPGPFLHWLVSDIDSSKVDSGNTIAPYLPPGAPPGNPHRYTFLVYEHDEKLNLEESENETSLGRVRTSTLERTKFDIENFAKTHNLGDPKLGNYFNGKLF